MSGMSQHDALFDVSSFAGVVFWPQGLLGQEVIKVISAQNRPCDNWLFLDGLTGTLSTLADAATYEMASNGVS